MLQREIALHAEARVGFGRHVAALEADEGLERVEARHDTGSTNLRQHRLEVIVSVREAFGVEVVVAVVRVGALIQEHAGAVEERHPESALLHVGDVLIDIVHGKITHPVDRGVEKRIVAALHPARQIVVGFHRGDLREKRVLARAGGDCRDAVRDAMTDSRKRVHPH